MMFVSRRARAWGVVWAVVFGLAGGSRASAAEAVAKILSMFDSVHIERAGKVIRPVRADAATLELFEKDFVVTGKRARARLEFKDHQPAQNRGPTIVNIAPRSRVQIASFLRPAGDQEPAAERGWLDLLRGSIRAFTKGWGKRSRFSIRTGTSLCGIRGTEVVAVYEPNRRGGPRASFTSVSGTVEVQDRAGTSGWTPLGRFEQRVVTPRRSTQRKLSQRALSRLLRQTAVGGEGDSPIADFWKKRYPTGGGGRGAAPGGEFMGVRWTSAGLPDCKAEIGVLMLNSYKWDDIKGYDNFTFYRDELINERFVVSGQVTTECPENLLAVEVSLDGGNSWASAKYDPNTLEFRYEFDPTGFSDLDLKVRPSFERDAIRRYRQNAGGR